MNLMSSMANTFVGSAIAIVIVAPVLLTGRMLYLRATSAATSLRTSGSISKCERLIDGHAELRRERLGDVVFGDEAQLDERFAELHAGGLHFLQRLLELLRRDELRLDEEIPELDGHAGILAGLGYGERLAAARTPPAPGASARARDDLLQARRDGADRHQRLRHDGEAALVVREPEEELPLVAVLRGLVFAQLRLHLERLERARFGFDLLLRRARPP